MGLGTGQGLVAVVGLRVLVAEDVAGMWAGGEVPVPVEAVAGVESSTERAPGRGQGQGVGAGAEVGVGVGVGVGTLAEDVA